MNDINNCNNDNNFKQITLAFLVIHLPCTNVWKKKKKTLYMLTNIHHENCTLPSL